MAKKLLTWEKDLQAREKRLHVLESRLQSQKEAIADEKKELEKRDTELNDIQKRLEQRLRQYKAVKEQLNNECERLRKLTNTVQEREKALEAKLIDRENELLRKEANLADREKELAAEIRKKAAELEREKKIRRDIEHKLADKEKIIETHLERISDLEAEIKKLGGGKGDGGGRPPTNHNGPAKPPGPHDHSCKCEIVCQKKGREWIVGVERQENISAIPVVHLLQNSIALQHAENGFWYLVQTNGKIVMSSDENGTRLKLGGKPCLVFKLSGQNGNYGRLMRYPSHGSYLLVAPESWRRHETLSGPAFAAPEPVSLTGYQAHFFDLEKGGDSKIAFVTQDNEPVVINTKARGIELVGNRLHDAEEKMGPLFGKEIPIIRALDEQVWKEVSLIIVGEEGLGRGKWRTEIKPIPEEQELPLQLSQTKIGWYFLRFYNKNHELIDSMDFRFIRELHEIKVQQSSPVPLNYEHKPTTVEFLHENECVIRPNDADEQNIAIERKDTKTIVTIPADSNCDKTRWFVCPKGKSEVPVTILVERLWWEMGDEDHEPSEWSCKLLKITRNDLTASSCKALWLRFPKTRWTNYVRAGFEHIKAKQFAVKVAEQTIAIPLRDFSESEELQGAGVKPFHVSFDHQGSEYTLLPSQLEINLKCTYCDFLVKNEEAFLDHVESMHIGELFKPLTYEEMRKYFPKLPSEIYKCAYCPFYAKSDDYPNNPNTTITHHIERDCPNAPRGGGPVHISFFPIDDVEEIKQNVQNKFIQKLQLYYKCTLCDDDLKKASKTLRMEHLIRKHQNELYALQ